MKLSEDQMAKARVAVDMVWTANGCGESDLMEFSKADMVGLLAVVIEAAVDGTLQAIREQKMMVPENA